VRRKKGGKKGRKVRSKSEISTDEEVKMEVEGEEEEEARFSGDEGEVKVEDQEEVRAGRARETLAMLKARVSGSQ